MMSKVIKIQVTSNNAYYCPGYHIYKKNLQCQLNSSGINRYAIINLAKSSVICFHFPFVDGKLAMRALNAYI